VIFGSSDLVSGDGLGFSITSPFKAVAKAATGTAKAVGKGTVAVGKGVEHGTAAAAKGTSQLVQKYGKTAATLAVLPVVTVNKAIVAPVLKATVLRPVISRINTLKDRRAKKLAWDNRKSPTPTPQERSQASSWTKAHLRSQAPPLGLMMSVLAGPPRMSMTGFGEPTTATITAAVPALVALLNSILSHADHSGDAPAHAGASGAQPVDPAGTHDLTPTQDAADQAAVDRSSAPSGGRGKSSGLPLRLTKKQLMIGGAALGGVVLLALLTRKS
jgi:hypothetical protein